MRALPNLDTLNSTVEFHQRLSISDLPRGTRTGPPANPAIDFDAAILLDGTTRIEIVRIAYGFGGVGRRLFVCPKCKKRCGFIYYAGLACRRCCGLYYSGFNWRRLRGGKRLLRPRPVGFVRVRS